MSRNYRQFAAGWLKENDRVGQYVSGVVEGSKVELLAKFEDGSVHKITNFAMYSNDKKNPKAPDVRFVFTVEE